MSCATIHCPQCEYTCTRLAQLQKHLVRKHSDISNIKDSFPCAQCSYVAIHKNTLKLHVQVKHEGLRYPCDHCSYQATQKGSLKLHIQSKHHGGITYVCHCCPLKYLSKTELEDHIRSVHENNPYTCDFCDFTTRKSSSLTSHLQSHVNFCDQCDFVGISMKHLIKHKSMNHLDITDTDEIKPYVTEGILEMEPSPEGGDTDGYCSWCEGYKPQDSPDCGPSSTFLSDHTQYMGPPLACILGEDHDTPTNCTKLYPELNPSLEEVELSFAMW